MGDSVRMSKLSRNFSNDEFKCPCLCGYGKMDLALVLMLEMIRTGVQRLKRGGSVPIKVTSGIRCREHNRMVKGAAISSWHVPRDGKCHAADITFSDPELRTPENILLLYLLADQAGAKGLGIYINRIHIDTRKTLGNARWSHESWENRD
tara:strand:+ start:2753 stop:3202 length:450 start_codon:yes stop_codon:yes gene_type:complete